RYHTKDASYCSANSRPTLAGLSQWFRIVSPRYHIDVERVTYDEDKNELFREVFATLRLRRSIFRAAPSRCVSLSNMP
ncbi:hypothetical protein BD311DRAFT_671389, partial [Dichomitus squalens]